MAVSQQGTYRLYIDGKWVDARSGETFKTSTRRPANSGNLPGAAGRCRARRRRRAEGIRELAAGSGAAPGGDPLPGGRTALQRKEELARLMTQEMGKVLAEARGDVQEAIDMTFYMAGEGRRLFGQTTPSELPNKFAMSVRDADRRRRR